MLFSFIVPVYNTSKYLDKCMESLLCQKGADFEILLIDDGSTDNSGELCDSYAKQYPDIVRVIHKENEGLLLTRRRGFKEAKGDWFICIDSDDYANTDLLKKVVETINQYHPDMVMYNFKYVNDSGETSKSRLKIKDESIYEGENKQFIYAHRLLTEDINNMWSKALKQDIVDVDTEYSGFGIRNMCEDALQVLPLFAKAQKIVYLSSPLYYYRKGQDSITASRSYESWLSSKSCFLQTEKYLDIWNVADKLRQRFYTHNLEYLSNFLRWAYVQTAHQMPKSFNTIIQEIRIHPAFTRCMKMYNKNYAGTRYLKFSVPIIMKKVQKGNAKGLKSYFAFESKLLKR
ncbi:MAG: glycosyltransferase family 2 protein [Ruminococcus sp.]|nr:glycosyltransferase family 2 protein [Ruminococcus sp.]